MTTAAAARLPRIGIGEATQLYGLSLRAIRFYEERGLITAFRDRQNHRYFDGTARRRLEWIALLRCAGLALEDIRKVIRADELSGGGRECALDKLNAKRRALELDLALIDIATEKLTGEQPQQ